ncbi:hypothetical protein [Microbacterium soli]|uniref:Tail assembly chaperone n=1 Tax=Microbacterium soli TaxID=446075 RepID=A0ABP7NIQ5_9MICO
MSTEDETAEVEPIPVHAKAPARKPKHMVVGDTFYTQTPDGELRIPLRFKTKLLRVIRDLPDEIDQLFALLDGLGDKATSEALDELDIFDTTEVAEKYFQAWQEKNEARLGEAQRSSRS